MKENFFSENIIRDEQISSINNINNGIEVFLNSPINKKNIEGVLDKIKFCRDTALYWLRSNKITDDNTVVSVKSIMMRVYDSKSSDRMIKVFHEVIKSRKNKINEISVTISFYDQLKLIEITFSFVLITQVLANFLRAGRNYGNYLNEEILNYKGYYEDSYTYIPGEKDRLVDEKRVDHIPALSLIEIIVDFLNKKDESISLIKANFNNYIDPRYNVLLKHRGDEEVLCWQNNIVAASVLVE